LKGKETMKLKYVFLLTSLCAGYAIAQDKPPASAPRAEAQGRHEPPPQAYEDCKGKKVGDAIQHTTREGKVAATCQDSPKGLVARPNRPKGAPPDAAAK
jgi:hypothetical protein